MFDTSGELLASVVCVQSAGWPHLKVEAGGLKTAVAQLLGAWPAMTLLTSLETQTFGQGVDTVFSRTHPATLATVFAGIMKQARVQKTCREILDRWGQSSPESSTSGHAFIT